LNVVHRVVVVNMAVPVGYPGRVVISKQLARQGLISFRIKPCDTRFRPFRYVRSPKCFEVAHPTGPGPTWKVIRLVRDLALAAAAQQTIWSPYQGDIQNAERYAEYYGTAVEKISAKYVDDDSEGCYLFQKVLGRLPTRLCLAD
jgi:hypothetical protein